MQHRDRSSSARTERREGELPLIVAAPDSFKGSCTAAAAAEAMLAGARSVFGDVADYLALPLADGGEGTLDALLAAWNEPPRTVRATDALGRPRQAKYGLSADGRTAIIEAAEANGLPWVADQPLQPLDADSRGVGALVRAALDAGATELLVTLGGSATNDGGTGLLSSLGVRFFDEHGDPVAPGARGLSRIRSIDATALEPRARAARWRIAVDVDNPLCGPRGAAVVFGPQKGATPEDIMVVDTGLATLAGALAEAAGDDLEAYLNRPGLGAAGGLALGCVALFGAELVPGSELVAEVLAVESTLQRAALVLTGEGRLDHQSLGGKVIDLVRRTAPTAAPIIVIAGSVELSAAQCRDAGLTAAFSIAGGPSTLDDLVAHAVTRIADTSAQACQAVRASVR